MEDLSHIGLDHEYLLNFDQRLTGDLAFMLKPSSSS